MKAFITIVKSRLQELVSYESVNTKFSYRLSSRRYMNKKINGV